MDKPTVVNLLDSPERTKNADGSGSQQENTSEVSQSDVKPTRELTEDEKTMLQEKLGWTDKQISKCTIDEDGVIHYKTDREDMEGKNGENGITYERKTVDIHGVKVQGVFPVFESVCDVQLPEDLENASNARQFRECNKQLKENVANDPELQASFTEEQLEEIEDGDTPSGYVWHHNEETGKMQLVKVEDHDRTQGGAAHTGGKALWGGSYSNHETSTTAEIDATQYSTSDKEVVIMAANVETMFYTREKPWHGLGTMVRESPSSVQALALAGLLQRYIISGNEITPYLVFFNFHDDSSVRE